jgi:hypothetical protein
MWNVFIEVIENTEHLPRKRPNHLALVFVVSGEGDSDCKLCNGLVIQRDCLIFLFHLATSLLPVRISHNTKVDESTGDQSRLRVSARLRSGFALTP